MKRKRFGGITAIAFALVFSMLFSTDVYATSRTTTTETTGIGRTADEAINADAQVLGARRNSAEGDGITIGSITDKNVIASLSDLEIFAKIISEYTNEVVKASELSILDSMDITAAPGTVVSADKPLFISFSFPGIVASSEVYVFHYSSGEWKLVPGTVVQGKITGEFSSLSPVAIVAKTSTLKGAVLGAKRAKSPRTGDNRPYVISACLILLFAGLFARKKIFS
ncbi:MAG: hypothetical protein E7306_09105 [Butyrivibrio sp.]|nr:hypothetical protein [Butyrivibrio sp.]